jgi:hypothetical protein
MRQRDATRRHGRVHPAKLEASAKAAAASFMAERQPDLERRKEKPALLPPQGKVFNAGERLTSRL